MKRLSIKVKEGGQVEVITEKAPDLETVETLFSNLNNQGVTIDTPSPNPALQLILCG